jgi:hypothetical protein
VKRRISVEIGGVSNGLRTSTSSPPGFDIYDHDEEVRLPEIYRTQTEAEAECERYNNQVSRLVLKSWNRLQLQQIGALSFDAENREVFVGLSREESELYVKLSAHTPTDEFIELDRLHRTARTGFEG